MSLSPIIAYHYHKYLFRTLFSERYVDRKHVQTRLVVLDKLFQMPESSFQLKVFFLQRNCRACHLRKTSLSHVDSTYSTLIDDVWSDPLSCSFDVVRP